MSGWVKIPENLLYEEAVQEEFLLYLSDFLEESEAEMVLEDVLFMLSNDEGISSVNLSSLNSFTIH